MGGESERVLSLVPGRQRTKEGEDDDGTFLAQCIRVPAATRHFGRLNEAQTLRAR